MNSFSLAWSGTWIASPSWDDWSTSRDGFLICGYPLTDGLLSLLQFCIHFFVVESIPQKCVGQVSSPESEGAIIPIPTSCLPTLESVHHRQTYLLLLCKYYVTEKRKKNRSSNNTTNLYTEYGYSSQQAGLPWYVHIMKIWNGDTLVIIPMHFKSTAISITLTFAARSYTYNSIDT